MEPQYNPSVEPQYNPSVEPQYNPSVEPLNVEQRNVEQRNVEQRNVEQRNVEQRNVEQRNVEQISNSNYEIDLEKYELMIDNKIDLFSKSYLGELNDIYKDLNYLKNEIIEIKKMINQKYKSRIKKY